MPLTGGRSIRTWRLRNLGQIFCLELNRDPTEQSKKNTRSVCPHHRFSHGGATYVLVFCIHHHGRSVQGGHYTISVSEREQDEGGREGIVVFDDAKVWRKNGGHVPSPQSEGYASVQSVPVFFCYMRLEKEQDE